MKKGDVKGISVLGIDEQEFMRKHYHQIRHRSQKDIFFIWMVIVFISVIAAHLVLNLTGGSPTGFVTAEEDSSSNMLILLGSLFVAFISCLITAIVYIGISKNDHY